MRGLAKTFCQYGRDIVEVVDHVYSRPYGWNREEIRVPAVHPDPRQADDAALVRVDAGKPEGEIQGIISACRKRDMAQAFRREFSQLRAQNLFRLRRPAGARLSSRAWR